jgi:hypothetical protein
VSEGLIGGLIGFVVGFIVGVYSMAWKNDQR